MIHHLLRSIGHFLRQHQTAVRVVARTLPMAVREIDRWISSASYQEAVQKVDDIARHDSDLLHQLFISHQGNMSSGVRRSFEERLRALGKIP